MADRWIERARRHAHTARELDDIADVMKNAQLYLWPGMFGGERVGAAIIRRLRALAEAERQERDRLMQAQDRADA